MYNLVRGSLKLVHIEAITDSRDSRPQSHTSPQNVIMTTTLRLTLGTPWALCGATHLRQRSHGSRTTGVHTERALCWSYILFQQDLCKWTFQITQLLACEHLGQFTHFDQIYGLLLYRKICISGCKQCFVLVPVSCRWCGRLCPHSTPTREQQQCWGYQARLLVGWSWVLDVANSQVGKILTWAYRSIEP